MQRLLLIVLPLLLIVGCSKPVEDSTLINKDGLMYLPESDKPYTGEVFTNYSTGEKLYKGIYDNGKLVWDHYLNKDGSVKEPINYTISLLKRNRVYYTKDTNRPYTGRTFSLYENGNPESRGLLKNGKKEGRWIYTYGGGEIRMKGIYKDGLEQGLWNKFYRNGSKEWETTYKDGKKDGLITFWDEGTYKNGWKDGLWTEWYENAWKSSEGHYKEGKKDGIWTSWWGDLYDNKKMHEYNYKNGRTITFKSWDYKDGTVRTNYYNKDGHYDGAKVERID